MASESSWYYNRKVMKVEVSAGSNLGMLRFTICRKKDGEAWKHSIRCLAKFNRWDAINSIVSKAQNEKAKFHF